MKGTGIIINDQYELSVLPLRDDTGLIVSGLVIGPSTIQDQGLLLVCHPGEFKELPIIGIGIEDMLLDNDVLEWRRKIRMQLELVGQTVERIEFSATKKLMIDAGYNN